MCDYMWFLSLAFLLFEFNALYLLLGGVLVLTVALEENSPVCLCCVLERFSPWLLLVSWSIFLFSLMELHSIAALQIAVLSAIAFFQIRQTHNNGRELWNTREKMSDHLATNHNSQRRYAEPLHLRLMFEEQ